MPPVEANHEREWPVARRTDFNDITRQRILKAIRDGQARKTAAEVAGICYELLRQWLRRGEKGEEPYVAFLGDFERAESEFLERGIQLAWRLAQSDYKHVVDFLGRRYPQEWGTFARQPEAPSDDKDDAISLPDNEEALMALLSEEVDEWRKKKTG